MSSRRRTFDSAFNALPHFPLIRQIRRRLGIRLRRPYGSRGNGSRSKGVGPIKGSRKYRKALMWKGDSFMPQIYYTHFDYNNTTALTTAGGFYANIYRGNSLYDPDLTGAGVYPLGYTAMINIYERYNVLSCTITARYVNNDTDDPVFVAIWPSRDGTAFGAARINDVLGQPRCKYIMLANAGGSGQVSNFQLTKDMFGFKDTDDVGLCSATNANPGYVWFWHVYIFNKSGNALSGVLDLSIHYNVKLTFLSNDVFAAPSL